MSFWMDQRVVVTGGAGFLGSHVVESLRQRGCQQVTAPRSKEYDLRDRSAIQKLFKDAQPTMVIHLAAVVGGIGANREHPGKFFYENAIMGIELIEQARVFNLPKLVVLGTICAYPKFTPVPFKEDAIWDGYPEETNAPYGLAKKMLLVQAQAYRQQFGMNAVNLLVVNLYGPGDNFDPSSSHVIPAMIRRFVDARDSGAPDVVLWGDGSPTREFVHVRDAARAFRLALENYDGPEPVNVGSGSEISIRDLSDTVARVVGYEGTISWDPSKPNGQPSRRLDTARAREHFGFEASTNFEQGLAETVRWYRSQLESGRDPERP
jgi:GDP-L-fucose synthase